LEGRGKLKKEIYWYIKCNNLSNVSSWVYNYKFDIQEKCKMRKRKFAEVDSESIKAWLGQ